MNKELSVYFDLIRFIACLAVLIYHSNMRNIIIEPIALSNYGHSAVIVFFVLSGYVISYITNKKEDSLLLYSTSRFARIYSVALPALIITPFLDILGESLNNTFYIGKTTHDYWYLRILAGLFFLNEIWFISIMEFSNVPYWSLCYEVWYYVIYGAFVFTRGRKRILILTCLLLFVGPKILLLFPIWCLGVFIYKNKLLKSLPEICGWIAFAASFFLFFIFDYFKIADNFNSFTESIIGPEWYKQLTFSKFFLSDYIFSSIIFINFIGFRAISHRFGVVFNFFTSTIRIMANHTFALYLFHQPLILVFAAAISGNPRSSQFYLETMFCVGISIYLLAKISENKKHLYKKIALYFIHKKYLRNG
ncbi:MAG: hypothetical protein CTY19_03285 [Methylomonas sp.]|nr:MAG: hypothetical protein CTY19_03285 [Methylomonas sp.]